ncbi:hypothetical protein SCUP234_09987 [Seiridium cupressi]
MVIQLSFLAWSHEHQSLSQALTQAIDNMLVESRTATSHGLNYVSLLGTVGACQQQTTGFSWAHHYAAIEDKIFKELTNSISRERPEKRRKSRSGQAITHVHQQSVSDRTLPYVILRGLVKSLDSIQRVPEDCILQLPCDRGISSVVLCCYHVLGISVLIRLIMRSLEVSAILLQRASENFPVSTLNRDDADHISDTFEELTTENQSNIDIDGFRWPIPDTLDCFEITCRLLLGSRFTKDYVAKAFLISSHGWSVFLDIMEASDPTDVASGTLHIKPGVPARDGIRKTQIIDGMTDFGIDAARKLLFNSEPRISFWPGVWTTKVVGTHIGYHGQDAFTVVQSYDWAHTGQHPEDEWNASRIPERIFRCRGPWYFYVIGDGAGNDQKTIIFNAAAMGKD